MEEVLRPQRVRVTVKTASLGGGHRAAMSLRKVAKAMAKQFKTGVSFKTEPTGPFTARVDVTLLDPKGYTDKEISRGMREACRPLLWNRWIWDEDGIREEKA